ncbi:MAG: leucyl/phenylalanyl-tRNA--protein transferase [Desulfobulbaceae bacterium]|nr:leucyl/phenylalanyl-tRNA--protein transferase [Desulfobulbaceae bacterium]
MPVFQLTTELLFPPPELARDDGLLAVGGDLSPERLILAYSQGIFPWYSAGEPILWWSPSPRLILIPQNFHCSKRLARQIRQGEYQTRFDTAFREVISHCAGVRRASDNGTWIVPEMIEAYCRLHELGFAHSVECWRGEDLVGGLYGVSLGGTFFGESMFSLAPNSSKIALAALCRRLADWDFDLIDCQMKTAHLLRLGAEEIDGNEFATRLTASLAKPTRRKPWREPAAAAIRQ